MIIRCVEVRNDATQTPDLLEACSQFCQQQWPGAATDLCCVRRPAMRPNAAARAGCAGATLATMVVGVMRAETVVAAIVLRTLFKRCRGCLYAFEHVQEARPVLHTHTYHSLRYPLKHHHDNPSWALPPAHTCPGIHTRTTPPHMLLLVVLQPAPHPPLRTVSHWLVGLRPPAVLRASRLSRPQTSPRHQRASCAAARPLTARLPHPPPAATDKHGISDVHAHNHAPMR